MSPNVKFLPAVLLALSLLSLLAPAAHAATQQQTELKQIKAELKLALAAAKAGTAQALADFQDDLDSLVASIADGSAVLNEVPLDLSQMALIAVRDVVAASRNAVNGVTPTIVGIATVPLHRTTLPGGFGDYDKFRAVLDASQAKAYKKMLAGLKKVVKAVPKASSGVYAVNVVLTPFPPVSALTADNTFGDTFLAPPATVSVLVGGGSTAGNDGIAIIGGLGRDTADVFVNQIGASTVTCLLDIWFRVESGLVTGRNLDCFARDAGLEVLIGFQSIGVPSVP
ncbi:MAG: hypothetical protein L6R28_21980 [Planctomycetes bacterium]|nr:hypothetical protein [Planctomycetota bacterium]